MTIAQNIIGEPVIIILSVFCFNKFHVNYENETDEYLISGNLTGSMHKNQYKFQIRISDKSVIQN